MKWLACVVALSIAAGTSSFAADIPPPVAPPPAAYMPVIPPFSYDWSGFYIGGNLGAGFNNSVSATDTFGSRFGTTTNNAFRAAAKLASITKSGPSSSSARRLCSIGFPIPKTPST